MRRRLAPHRFYTLLLLSLVIVATHRFIKEDSNNENGFSTQDNSVSFQYEGVIRLGNWDSMQSVKPFSQPCSNCSLESYIQTYATNPASELKFSSHLEFLRHHVSQLNANQQVQNLGSFDLRGDGDGTVVIVVQVHNRTAYLQELIKSLRRARNIENSVLIFSHDYLSNDINSLIASIDFCLVVQIFFPYSMQLYPTEFPGEDPRDCPRNINKDQAKQLNCINADHPDKYYHYREAKYSQIKHHWFWKMNHVFDRLSITQYFNGLVLLLEEDHYVAPDFIPVLTQMYRMRKRVCELCNIFTLGTYDKSPGYGAMASKVDVMSWISSKHNMGMAFDRTTWNKIVACGEVFCRFDDYNWDWSLNFIGLTCIPSKLRVITVKSPRVFHMGECGGVHSGKKTSCDPLPNKVAEIEKILESSKLDLFPASLTVNAIPYTADRVLKPNGGWGDPRDHDLCIRLKANSRRS